MNSDSANSVCIMKTQKLFATHLYKKIISGEMVRPKNVCLLFYETMVR
jgi:hypothetical protein